MLTKRNIQLLISMFLMLFITACSDSDKNAVSNKVGNGEVKHAENINTVKIIDDDKNERVDMQRLIQMAERNRKHANELGYEWSTIKPLIDKAYVAKKQGNEKLAMSLFKKANEQSKLAIAQANYAKENWKILVPKNN